MAEAAVLMEEAGCGFSQCPGHGRGRENPNSPFWWLWGGISQQPLSLSAIITLNPAVPRAVLGQFHGRIPKGTFSCGLCCHLRSPRPFSVQVLPNPPWLSLVGIRGVEDLDRKGACLQPFIWLLLKPCVPPDKNPACVFNFYFSARKRR